MFERLKRRNIFQVLSQAREEAAYNVGQRLESLGSKVREIRLADVIDADGSKIDEVFVYVCEGSSLSYMRIRKYYPDEIMYEGRKTLM